MSIWSTVTVRANAALLRIFGESITISIAGGAADPATITAVWDDDESLMPKGVRATAWLLETALGGARVAKNDLVRRGNFTYRIVDPPAGLVMQKDGSGGITIFLRQISHATDA
jgi:hypothetical protein